MREYIGRLLTGRWAVETVADGVQALGAIRQRRPDLVLTDVMMPNLDGFGLLRTLRDDRETASIPVIMLSARAGEESRVDGLQVGADDYLPKPFSAKELIARVTTHLELGRMRNQAESASRAKDEFLAILGHELRNPLAPMLTSLRLLQMKGIRTAELEVLERQVGALMRLVDDLMDVSRITRGKIELRKSRFELSRIVLQGLETAGPLLEQRRHPVDLRVPVEGLAVEGDPDRLSQVVSNLLTNAAKYSDAGSAILVTAERVDGRVQLRVRDRGIGIPAQMLTQVFEMFVQQPQALDRAKGGIGLGLTIVRSLVELHQGRVWANSDGPCTGSEFVVELPLVSTAPMAEQPAILPSVDHPALSANGHARILIVDDNQDAAESLAEFLAECGHLVRTAHDGPSGIELAASFKPTICLIDIGLPVMDGYEVARRLRALEGLPTGVRLLAVTGYGQGGDRRRSSEAGFDDHLVKPVDLEQLARSLSN